MNRIESLLVATDFSDDARAAQQRAVRLAARLGARLELLHVMSGPSLSTLRELFNLAADAGATLIEDARRQLEEMAAALAGQDAPAPATQLRVGHVVNEILAAAAQHDMLVVGAHGTNPLRDFILGTTAERLLNRSKRPMLVVKRPPQVPYRRVLVPVDFSPYAAIALRGALSIAPDAEITLFHAFDNPYEGKLWLAGVGDDLIHRYRLQAQQQALGRIDDLLAACGHPPHCFRLVEHGSAAPLILAREADLDIDLIVIGRHGQQALEELLIGSVTRHVITDAKCDVLVVSGQPGASGA